MHNNFENLSPVPTSAHFVPYRTPVARPTSVGILISNKLIVWSLIEMGLGLLCIGNILCDADDQRSALYLALCVLPAIYWPQCLWYFHPLSILGAGFFILAGVLQLTLTRGVERRGYRAVRIAGAVFTTLFALCLLGAVMALACAIRYAVNGDELSLAIAAELTCFFGISIAAVLQLQQTLKEIRGALRNPLLDPPATAATE